MIEGLVEDGVEFEAASVESGVSGGVCSIAPAKGEERVVIGRGGAQHWSGVVRGDRASVGGLIWRSGGASLVVAAPDHRGEDEKLTGGEMIC